MLKVWFFLFLSFFSEKEALAQAPFYLSPPPRGFGGIDSLDVRRSTRYDSEVESDHLSFLPVPCHFQSALNRSNNFFCGHVGSLGSKRFLVDMDLAFTHSLSDRASFRFHGVKKQDYSSDVTAEVAELLYRLNDHSSLGVHGQFDTFKSEDDLGLSYNFHGENLWARLEGNAYDYSRNNRNEKSDRFSRSPHSLTATLLKERGNEKYFLNMHFEPEWIWRDDARSLEVKQSRQWVEGFWARKNAFYSLESKQDFIHFDQAFEEEKLLRLHGQTIVDFFTLGVRGVRRSWRSDQGRLVHHNLLPFVWYQPTGRWEKVDIGYEFTWHTSNGDEALKTNRDKSFAIEHRLNVLYSLFENDSGYFKLLFSFDLDRFGSGETWEGGSGQLAFTF